MDAIDRKILTELQRDGRITVTELASRVGLSLSPCHRRMRDLEAGGAILGYRALVDRTALGLRFHALVFVTMRQEDRETLLGFERAVSGVDAVVSAQRLFGDPDYLLSIVTADLDAYRDLEDRRPRRPARGPAPDLHPGHEDRRGRAPVAGTAVTADRSASRALYPGGVTSTTAPSGSDDAPSRGPGVGAAVATSVVPALAVAAVVALALSTLSGAETFVRLGLPDPGAIVVYGLPVVRALAQSAAVATVGALLLVAFLVPPGEGSWLSRDGYRGLRVAAWTAGIWAVAALMLVPLSVADGYGRPLSAVLDARILVTSVTGISAAGAWTVTAVVALVIAAMTRVVLSWGTTVPLLALATAGLAPVALTGHSASGGSHDLATNSLLFHIVAAALWVGGLLALVVHLGAGGGAAGTAARRFSRLALVCWVVMAVSGVVNTAVRMPAEELFTSTYGLLIVLKVLALAALGAFGAWHRARSLPALEGGSRGGLVRFGGVEVLVMFATLGVAAALGRTPPPAEAGPSPDRVEALIGYPLDGPLTLAGLVTESRFDLVFGTAALVLAGLYLAGVRRLRRRGDPWPVGRTVAWSLGCLTLLVATSSGLGRYAPAQFSIHMGQHMLLNMLVPILLVLGAPTMLALRALPVAGRDAPPGPREWLLAAIRSPVARVLAHPLVALTLFVGSFYVLYFSGLFDAALEAHWAHLAMNAHFLLVGYLFFWPIVGIDPSPRPLPPMGRLGLLLVAIPLHAFFGVAVMSADTVIGGSFYTELGLPWVDLLADQTTGGGLAWASGELPMLVVLIALLVQWSRQDERAARSADRRADRDGDRELAEYNAMLRGLAAGDCRDTAVTSEDSARDDR